MTRQVLIPKEIPAHLPAPDPAGRVSVFAGKSMGTSWRVHAVLPDSRPPANAHSAILVALDTVVRQMSHWDPESELCRFNRAPAGTWQRLSPEFFAVLHGALDIAAASDGAYDPTIGKLVDLFGFGPAEPPARLSSVDIATAHRHSGWQAIRLNTATRSAFQPGGWQLDLSSIAKGFAVDLVSETLTGLGVHHSLVEIGGELIGQGCKPDGTPWWCQLETPAEPGAETLPETIAALCGMAVASSGDTLRRRQFDGHEISHLIDPRTGQPAPPRLATVSVFAPTCMVADAWATALFIAGGEAGFEQAESLGLAARFILRGPQGLAETSTTAYQAMLQD